MNRLMLPEILAVSMQHSFAIVSQTMPLANAFGFAGFVYDPCPRNKSFLACKDEIALTAILEINPSVNSR